MNFKRCLHSKCQRWRRCLSRSCWSCKRKTSLCLSRPSLSTYRVNRPPSAVLNTSRPCCLMSSVQTSNGTTSRVARLRNRVQSNWLLNWSIRKAFPRASSRKWLRFGPNCTPRKTKRVRTCSFKTKTNKSHNSSTQYKICKAKFRNCPCNLGTRDRSHRLLVGKQHQKCKIILLRNRNEPKTGYP